MRTLVHLSDLHFGRVDPALLFPLRDTIRQIDPQLVVVSGDLTQRARASQFIQARQFLDTLPKPQIIVPGNHDVPLYNVLARFLTPLANYKRYVSKDIQPNFIDEEIAVVGINTARSLTIKDGRINNAQIDQVRQKLCGLDSNIIKIIVTHHPFDLPKHYDESDLVDRAPAAMQAFAHCGADLLLAGHMHASLSQNTSARYRIGDFSAIVAQAGTATSTRGRGESNSFNLVRINADEIEVERFAWVKDDAEFRLATKDSFARRNNEWCHKGAVMFLQL